MSKIQPNDECRIKAQALLDGLVIPGTLPGAVTELLDALVSDMRVTSAQAAADAQELAATEKRIEKLESQVRVLTAAVVGMANGIVSLDRHLRTTATDTKSKP